MIHKREYFLFLAPLFFAVNNVALGFIGSVVAVVIMLLGAATGLFILALAKRSFSFRGLQDNFRPILLIGVLEAVNFISFSFGLRIGSPLVVAAVHLSAPLVLALWATRGNILALSVPLRVSLVLLLLAIIVPISISEPETSLTNYAIGIGLSLFSAVIIAIITVIITSGKVYCSPETAGAAQCFLAGLTAIPLLFFFPFPEPSKAVLLFGIGMIVTAGAFFVLWSFSPGVNPVVASMIGLTEIVFNVCLMLVVKPSAVTFITVMSAGLVLAALIVMLSAKKSALA